MGGGVTQLSDGHINRLSITWVWEPAGDDGEEWWTLLTDDSTPTWAENKEIVDRPLTAFFHIDSKVCDSNISSLKEKRLSSTGKKKSSCVYWSASEELLLSIDSR